jgi:hypothetical protein
VAEVDQRTTPALSTRWVNFLDLCALALPNGMTRRWRRWFRIGLKRDLVAA